MKGKRNILLRLTESADLPAEPLPGVPLIEIAGEQRVLVENHKGVREYSSERILIHVRYGHVCICGSCLVLSRMTNEQLVISGRIDSVHLARREH